MAKDRKRSGAHRPSFMGSVSEKQYFILFYLKGGRKCRPMFVLLLGSFFGLTGSLLLGPIKACELRVNSSPFIKPVSANPLPFVGGISPNRKIAPRVPERTGVEAGDSNVIVTHDAPATLQVIPQSSQAKREICRVPCESVRSPSCISIRYVPFALLIFAKTKLQIGLQPPNYILFCSSELHKVPVMPSIFLVNQKGKEREISLAISS